jgi:hypothetical protein
MKNLQEQTKQKIILELERARFCAAFLIALLTLFVSLVFTQQYFGGNVAIRCTVGFVVLALFLLLMSIRKKCIHRVKKYIENL